MPRSSNWPEQSPQARSAEQPSSRPEQRRQEWLTGQPVNQLTKNLESRFRSRVQRRLKGVRFPVQDLEKWELWCKINHLDFQDFTTAACAKLYDELCGRPVNQLTTINDLEDHDDSDDDAVSSSSSLFCDAGQPVNQAEQKAAQMLAFYGSKTGNAIKQRDRESYFQGNESCRGVAELPEHAIKLGIMQSVLLCKGRVNSLSYCLGAIWEAHESGVTCDMVEYLQRTYAARLELRANPSMEHSEYFTKLKNAAEGKQPTLPGAGAELKSFKQ